MYHLETYYTPTGEFKFYYKESAQGTPVAYLISEYNKEMYSLGFNDENTWLTPYQNVIWAEYESCAVGFIAISQDFKETLRLCILGAYVDPAYRKQRCLLDFGFILYDQLVEEVKKLAEYHQCTKILSGTQANNIRAQRAFERQGRKKTGILYELHLNPQEPDSYYKDS